jgi:hypothetical protein
MKLFISASSVVLASFLAVGCSSSSSGSGSGGKVGSTTSALATFRKPTGTFNASTSKSAIASMWQQQQQGGKLQGQTGGGGGTATRAIRPLADSLSSGDEGGPACAEGARCSCEAGGSFSYQHEAADEGKAVRIAFSECMSSDGSGFDGEALVLVANKPLLDDPKLPKATSAQSVLLVAEGNAIEGKERQKVGLALLAQSNVVLVAVEVEDGTIVLGAMSDGTIIVRSKDASYTCAPGKSSYTCKDDASGETIVVDGSDQASGPSPAPSGSSSNGSAPTPPPKG